MLPSGLGSTAVTAGHFMPAGSSPQSRTVRYGVGRSFTGAFGSPMVLTFGCEKALPGDSTSAAAIAAHRDFVERIIGILAKYIFAPTCVLTPRYFSRTITRGAQAPGGPRCESGFQH